MVGLLPQNDPMSGLLAYDPDAVKKQALLQAGLAMMANSGPSPYKQNLGSIIGKGGMVGMQAFNEGQQRAVQKALMQRQLAKSDRDEAREDEKIELQRQRILAGQDGPMSVQETNWFLQQPEDVQRKHLALKRAQQVVQYGGTQNLIDPLNPTGGSQALAPLEEEIAVAEAKGAADKGYRRTPDGKLVPIEGAPASSTLDSRLFEVNDAAFKARSNQEQYSNLAEQMETVLPAAGEGAKWTESLKAITGDEDATTNLRKQWNNLRVSAAVQNLPPGVASDKDIELVMSAFLPEFANPEAVASFMRGLSKLEAIKGDYHEFEAEYLSKNRSPVGLNKAWREYLKQQGGGEQPARKRYNPETGQLE